MQICKYIDIVQTELEYPNIFLVKLKTFTTADYMLFSWAQFWNETIQNIFE